MATLHKVTEETRLLLKGSLFTILTIIILLFAYRIGINLKEYYYPTPPPPPTVSFGKLPPIPFSKTTIQNTFTYTINTISGTLPTFPTQINVYTLVQPEPNLLAVERAKQRVSQIGFSSNSYRLSDTLYQWTQEGIINKKLIYDPQSLNFTLSSNYLYNPQVFEQTSFISENDAISQAQSFLANTIVFPDDIDLTKSSVQLFTLQDAQLIKASSKATTQVIRVNFFQKDINGLPMYYPNPPYSTMHTFLLSKQNAEIVQAMYYHHTISPFSATYPLKTPEEAWQELQKGQGFVASYDGKQKEVVINNITLGYYLSGQPQTYLMPIIVFQGSNNFYAYVSAVKNEWTLQNP